MCLYVELFIYSLFYGIIAYQIPQDISLALNFLFIIMVGMNYAHKAPPTTHEHRRVYVETMYGLKCCF